MKRIVLALLAALVSIAAFTQTYVHPSTGVQSTYSGGCPQSTCSGNYYDPGGAASNYPNNINNIYQTFCPSTAGNCMRVTFTAFNTENNYDWLTIGNGPAQNSTLFATAPANASGQIMGNLTGAGAVPFSYTANNSSGCLTMRFYSDFITTKVGWAASFSCVPCGTTQAAGNSDCSNSTQICSNTSFNDLSYGPGVNATEGCTGCVTGENYSNWYTFVIATSGTLMLTVNPNTATDDLDFAVYGPGATCGALGTPVRCSYAASSGNTGIGNGAADNSEDVYGNGWVAPMNVTAGQVYRLMVNNWTAGGLGFNLSFTGTASLNCTPLPIELVSFTGKAGKNVNTLSWKTMTERDNDYYVLERSIDGQEWNVVAQIDGAGNSMIPTSYSYEDTGYNGDVINYYRLSQRDFDGTLKVFDDMVAIDNLKIDVQPLHYFNTLGQRVEATAKGVVIVEYTDGTTARLYNP